MFFEHALNMATTSAGLAIKEAKSAAAKVANTTHFHIDGELFYVTTKDIDLTTDADGNDITIEDDMQCMLTVMVDIDAAIHVVKGMEYTKSEHYHTDFISKAHNEEYAILGYIYIKNETGSQFVG
jgi:flagellar basal body rod protein FlgB